MTFLNISKFFFDKTVSMFVLIAAYFSGYWVILVKTVEIVEANIVESVKFMSGKVLRVAIIHYPPSFILTRHSNGTVSYAGVSHEAMQYITKALNISYEYVLLNMNDVKRYGVGPAQMNSIINGETDLAMSGLMSSHSRYQKCDFSTPTMIESFKLVVPYPKEESRLLAPIRPFQPMVWLALGLSIVITAPILNYLVNLYHKQTPNDKMMKGIQRRRRVPFYDGRVIDSFIFLIAHLTNHRFFVRLDSLASYIVVGTWLLVTVVLANAYAGTLFSFLSVAKLEPAINSLDELAKTTNIQLVLQAHTELADQFLGAISGPESVIGDSLRANPSNLISTLGEAKEKLKTGNYAFTYLEMFNHALIDATYRESAKKCLLTLGKVPISFFAPIVCPLAKNGPYTQAVSEALQAQIEAGLTNTYLKNFTPRIDQCKMENQGASARIEALSLVDMSSAFVVFALGVSLSILVFLLELIYKCTANHCFADDMIVISVQPAKPSVTAVKVHIPAIIRTVDRQVNNAMQGGVDRNRVIKHVTISKEAKPKKTT